MIEVKFVRADGVVNLAIFKTMEDFIAWSKNQTVLDSKFDYTRTVKATIRITK